jgi:hypothetical protein
MENQGLMRFLVPTYSIKSCGISPINWSSIGHEVEGSIPYPLHGVKSEAAATTQVFLVVT